VGNPCSPDVIVRLSLIFPTSRSLLVPLVLVLRHLIKLSLVDHHQLSIILDVLGTPSIDDFYAITSQRSREYIRALPFRKKKNFSLLFPGANPLVSFVYSRVPGCALITCETYCVIVF
jgi:hypothetical protein